MQRGAEVRGQRTGNSQPTDAAEWSVGRGQGSAGSDPLPPVSAPTPHSTVHRLQPVPSSTRDRSFEMAPAWTDRSSWLQEAAVEREREPSDNDWVLKVTYKCTVRNRKVHNRHLIRITEKNG